MNGKRFLTIGFAVVLLLALIAGLGRAQGPTGESASAAVQEPQPPGLPAGVSADRKVQTVTGPAAPPLEQTAQPSEAAPAGPLGLTADLGNGFYYQGILTEDGLPVDGHRPMEFKLWTLAAGGSQVGTTISKDVTLVHGQFNVALTGWGADEFNGQKLYLEVRAIDSSFTWRSLGRKEILPVPYAMSLLPGANVGTTGTGEGLTVSATSGAAVVAKTTSGKLFSGVDSSPGPTEKFYVTNVGDVHYDGALEGAFPRPAYNTGWVSVAQGSITSFTHDLGGSADNYFVDLQCKSSGYGVHILYHGGDTAAGVWEGTYYYNLTNTTVAVVRGFSDLECGQIRVRIWIIK